MQCGEVFVSFTEEIWKTEKGEKLGFVLSKCEQYKHFHIQPSRMHCRASLIAKESTCNAGDPSSIPGSGRSAWEGIGYPLQCSWASFMAQLVKKLYLFYVQSLSCVQFFATLWTVTHQAPLPMEFSRQEYWSGLPSTSPGDFPNPGIKSASLASPTLMGGFFTTEPPGKLLDSSAATRKIAFCFTSPCFCHCSLLLDT